MDAVTIEYFSDVLCVWAYGAEARMSELRRQFGARCQLHYRFIPLFAAAHERISDAWEEKRGLAGFGAHVREIARDWPHAPVHASVWDRTAPASSVPAHLLIKAVQLMERHGQLDVRPGDEFEGRSVVEEVIWRIRCAFFRDARDVAAQAVLAEIAAEVGLDAERLRHWADQGNAHAELHLDMEARDRYQVPGSPTLVMDGGRQRLYGNVGYRVIEANLREILRDPQFGEASWC